MRKLLLSLACLLFMAGLVVAAEVTLVKFDKDKGTLTVKDGDKETTYKVSDKVKYTYTDKDGNAKEAKTEVIERVLGSDKAAGKLKLDITTDKDTVTEVKIKGGKK